MGSERESRTGASRRPRQGDCFYGSDDTGALCPGLNPKWGKAIMLPGGHHFDGEYEKIARLIIGLAGKN